MLGGTAYDFLVNVKKMPFPTKRCLQYHLAKVRFEPGELYEDMFKMIDPISFDNFNECKLHLGVKCVLFHRCPTLFYCLTDMGLK